MQTVKRQWLKGGALWAAERLIGRVRYLNETFGLALEMDASLDAVEAALRPNEDKWVLPNSFGDNEYFPIRCLLEDVETLRNASVEALDPWWRRLGWNDSADVQDDTVVARVLDEHFRRLQAAHSEIVSASFPRLANEMKFSVSGPLRWHLTLRRANDAPHRIGMYYEIMPVRSYDQAGADVRFSDNVVEFDRSYFDRVTEALAAIGRPTTSFFGRCGSGLMPSFDGYQWNGHFDGATTVVHQVCSILKDELEEVFSSIPHRDNGL